MGYNANISSFENAPEETETPLESEASVESAGGISLPYSAQAQTRTQTQTQTQALLAANSGAHLPSAPVALATAKSVRDIDLSHDALARRMGQAGFDAFARYVAASNKWYLWDKQRWQRDDTQAHLSEVRTFLWCEAEDLCNRALVEASRMKSRTADQLISWAKKEARNLKDRATISAVSGLAQANHKSAARAEDFDQDLMLVGTPEGTVDLRTGALRAADPQDMITKLTARGPSQPDARPELWLKFLNRVFKEDQEVIDFMQRVAGYALTGMTSEHKFLFLYGGGRNGKSVFLDTLKWLLGDYAKTASANLLLSSRFEQHPTGLAGLQGARLVVASEIPKGATWNEAMIKDLTGGEMLSARVMRGDFFDFRPQLTLMIAGNEKPRLKGVDPAIRARMVLVPFEVEIPAEERDPHLSAKLQAEGSAILSWAIEGALSWQQRGLDVPRSIADASKEYLDDEDVLQRFLQEETTANPTGCEKTQDLYERYCLWCKRQGLPTGLRSSFRNDLRTHGLEEVRRNSGKAVIGLSLLENVPE